jgi:hypothetical protein
MIDEDSRERQIPIEAMHAGQGASYVRGVREALDPGGDPCFELWFLHPGHIEAVPIGD